MHPRPLGKKKNPKERKKKEAFSCPNMNSCFYIIINKTYVLKLIPIVQSFNTAEPGFTTLRNLFVTCKKNLKMTNNKIIYQPVDHSDRKAEKQPWVKKQRSAFEVIV